MRKEHWSFGGVSVAKTDAGSCGARAPSGYMCTRVPEHDGPHVAHVFRETGTGRPSGVVDAWPSIAEGGAEMRIG